MLLHLLSRSAESLQRDFFFIFAIENENSQLSSSMQLLCLSGLEPSLNTFICLPGFQYFFSLCFLHEAQKNKQTNIKTTLSIVSKYHFFSYFSYSLHSTYLCAMVLQKTISKQGKLVLPEFFVRMDTHQGEADAHQVLLCTHSRCSTFGTQCAHLTPMNRGVDDMQISRRTQEGGSWGMDEQ